MPNDGAPLIRRYRRLLLTYPRAYRRERGDELLDTLRDAARPGRTRPTVREAVNLIGHGLRCRLGRPASRTVVVWAVLTAVVWGLFGAAAATRVAWETARPLPDPVAARAVLSGVFPEHEIGVIEPAPALFLIYGQPLSWEALPSLLFFDGGEYGPAAVGTGVTGHPPIDPDEIVARTRQRLRDGGWQVADPLVRNAVDCPDGRCDPTNLTTLVAQRGDTILTVEVSSRTTVQDTYLWVALTRAAPLAVHPAAMAGGLLGAAIAWLVFGWASRRTEGRSVVRVTVTMLFGLALVLWWLPVLLTVPGLLRHHRTEAHPTPHPLWEWLGQPAGSLLFVVGCAAALLGLALATLPRRQPALHVGQRSATPAG
ncbi:hypothetical protein [Micromonospora echinofusca]|uniref:Uncharacterized protein n=1 Tax=Micromonospora echinofusca TaxID=47858 RepID=A0ABS3VLB7_MICEH|nr:hypothetical protein [Micromonospora echinofusca]MBO4205256.1 hypothetical protein [Micromonospora echinofusca]